MIRRFCSFFIFAFFIANSAYAGTTVTARVDPVAATVGDRLTYEITIITDKQSGAPVKPEPLLGDTAPFELLDSKVVTENEQAHKLIFTLSLFQTGRFQLPIYTWHWIDAEGKSQSVSSEPLFVEILSVLRPDQKEPEDIEIGPPAEALLDWQAYVLPALVTIVFLAIAAALFWRFKKRTTQEINVVEQKTATPAEAALKLLSDLERKNLLQSGQPKKYFTELSDCLREYLEQEFAIDAMEKTTYELEPELPIVLEGQREPVISLLQMCDTVKFAKATLPLEEAQGAIDDARDIIITTSKINKKVDVAGGMETAREHV